MSKFNLIIDSSVMIKWLSSDKEEHLDNAKLILLDVQKHKANLIAPELSKYEVGNVLLAGKKLSTKQGQFALTQFYNLPITFISESKEQSKETFELAYNLKITYYDACFISLTKQYKGILITDNIKHQGKISDIKVVALKDYNINTKSVLK